jgi:hypothetical protein
MSLLAPAALDLSKYTLANPHAHEIVPGDLIGVSGDWCAVTTFPVPDQPVNPMWVEIQVAPIDAPDRPRPWQILRDARMAVLRELVQR